MCDDLLACSIFGKIAGLNSLESWCLDPREKKNFGEVRRRNKCVECSKETNYAVVASSGLIPVSFRRSAVFFLVPTLLGSSISTLLTNLFSTSSYLVFLRVFWNIAIKTDTLLFTIYPFYGAVLFAVYRLDSLKALKLSQGAANNTHILFSNAVIDLSRKEE